MTRLVHLIPLAIYAAPLAAQSPLDTTKCEHGPADQQLTVDLRLEHPIDSLKIHGDSIMAVLGYQRATPASDKVFYLATPRLDWPIGTERAPWRGLGAAPGTVVAVEFSRKGKATLVRVTTRILCALRDTESSKDKDSPEHTVALFSGMQVLIALDGHVDNALHAFDR